MIGLKRGTVKLVTQNAIWKKSFGRERKKLKKVFGKEALDIQHVGSTAITGIAAKPVIDIGIIVPSLKKARKHIEILKRLGYELKKNDANKNRLFFTKGPEEKRTHYLHIGEVRSNYVEDMILFRDWLWKHKKAANEYDELKKKLARQYPNKRYIYTEKKTKFVKAIVEKAKNSW